MDIKITTKYILSVFLPFLLGGTILGAIFGGLGYFMSYWLKLFETTKQNEMVFWLFLALGVFAGAVSALQSLIAFLKLVFS